MAKKRVHIVSAVNAKNVSKDGSTFTIREVCGAVDDIVMNGMLYPGDQLAAGIGTMEGKPAPAGHPKNAAGQFISALNGEALGSAWVGAYCRNARHEAGRSLVDVVVNADMARAHPAGKELIERLDAAIAGTNTEPIHVSTGVLVEAVNASGESGGRKYSRIATNLQYDHLAILLDERGAGTPEDGVGMFLNAAGQPEAVERVEAQPGAQDRRGADGFLARWLRRLVGNGTELSFEAISSGLWSGLPEGAWVRDVFERYAVWSDRDGTLWKQDYSVSSDGSVAWTGTAVEVTRRVSYETITTNREDPMKDFILNALKAAGIAVDGKTDEQLMRDYDALKAKPLQDQVTAANSKVAEFEANAKKAEETEKTELATALAVNSALTVDDFKAMPLARLRELKAKAAPVTTGGGGDSGKGDEFAGYSLNAHFEEKK